MKNLAFLPLPNKNPSVSLATFPMPLGSRYAVLKGASVVELWLKNTATILGEPTVSAVEKLAFGNANLWVY